MLRRLLICLLLVLSVLPLTAQPAPAVAIALALENDALILGELALSSDTNTIQFSATGQYARTDAIGLVRFVPSGGPEGVYTFPPYLEGWSAPSATQNRLWAQEAALSPNGSQLAFRIENPNFPDDIAHGVWFWQPARELATDPSYQLLRHCPPCAAASASDTDSWRTTSIAWSSDNFALLIGLELRAENRRALHVAYALRDPDNRQANSRAVPLRYAYGHWALNGERIIVSGADPQNEMMLGSIERDGRVVSSTLARTIGLTWVQDAVDTADGRLVFLGRAQAQGALQVFDQTGSPLTQPIGAAAPDVVRWNAAHTAVFVRIGTSAYVAHINGTIWDISGVVKDIPAVNWVPAGLPAAAQRLPDPLPSVTGAPPKAGDSAGVAPALPPPSFSIGQLMQVQVSGLALYAEPVLDAEVRGTLNRGDELILTGGPLTDGVNLWWRVQALNVAGWLTESRDGLPTLQAVP